MNKLKRIPLTPIFIVFILCNLGFVILYSAADGNIYPWCSKQIINFIIFLPICFLVALIDIRLIYRFSYTFYFVILLMLIAVELFGSVAMGGQRWISLGIIKMQPSEPAKIAVVLMLAKSFHQIKSLEFNNLFNLFLPILGVALPVILIIKQPDLGTGMVVLIVSSIIFFAIGLAIKKFIILGISILGLLPILWHMMYDYQKKRVLMFLDPSQDPLGAGYNIIQSKIAIGSGGMLGKGITKGTQSHLDFLPEHQTDFIFATMAEELGFIGGGILLALYALLIYISLSISINSKHIFGKIIAIGISSIFFSHIFINMAMVMGLLPVVGVPLPFISYGGTMMASLLIGFGLILNVEVHKNQNIY